MVKMLGVRRYRKRNRLLAQRAGDPVRGCANLESAAAYSSSRSIPESAPGSKRLIPTWSMQTTSSPEKSPGNNLRW